MRYLLNGQETERLYFRLLVRDDFNTWLELFEEEGVSRFIGMDKVQTPKAQCENWFEKIEHRYKNDLGGMNVLIDKITNEFIGQSGLLIQEVDQVKELEVAYSILPKYWNKGYATEAAQKCRDFAFENDYSDSLISIVHVDNIKSEKVAIKNGMALNKTTEFRNMSVNIFRIYKSDWIKNQYK